MPTLSDVRHKLPDMPENVSVRNYSAFAPSPALEGSPRPAWAVTALSSVLIFTTAVDILGNFLVIMAVFRNKKLRNTGKLDRASHCSEITIDSLCELDVK